MLILPVNFILELHQFATQLLFLLFSFFCILCIMNAMCKSLHACGALKKRLAGIGDCTPAEPINLFLPRANHIAVSCWNKICAALTTCIIHNGTSQRIK